MWLDLGLKGAIRVLFLFSCFVLQSLPWWVLSQASHCGQAPTPSSAVTSWQALGKEEESFSRAARSMSLPTSDSDWPLCPSCPPAPCQLKCGALVRPGPWTPPESHGPQMMVLCESLSVSGDFMLPNSADKETGWVKQGPARSPPGGFRKANQPGSHMCGSIFHVTVRPIPSFCLHCCCFILSPRFSFFPTKSLWSETFLWNTKPEYATSMPG